MRASAAGSGQRSGLSSDSSRVRVHACGSTATPPTSAVNDQISTPSALSSAFATPPAATRAVVSRADLMRSVWGYDASIVSRTVDTHVVELRRKLEEDPAHPRHILTVRKAGYRLQA